MMDVFIISRLLLLTLLLQGTEENEQWADDSVHFGKFCLRIADDSRTTTAKPDPKPLKVVTEDYSGIEIKPVNIVHRQVVSGCRCNKENMRQPNETSKVTGSTKWYPSETCSSTEYIETLADGREVCVTPFSLLDYLQALFGGKVMAPPPDDLTTTEPPLRGGPSSNSRPHDSHCTACLSIATNSDPKIVRSLEVTMQPFPCHPHIYIYLKNGKFFCLDLFHFEMRLQQLEISLPLEENADIIPINYILNVVDACRCREKAKNL